VPFLYLMSLAGVPFLYAMYETSTCAFVPNVRDRRVGFLSALSQPDSASRTQFGYLSGTSIELGAGLVLLPNGLVDLPDQLLMVRVIPRELLVGLIESGLQLSTLSFIGGCLTDRFESAGQSVAVAGQTPYLRCQTREKLNLGGISVADRRAPGEPQDSWKRPPYSLF